MTCAIFINYRRDDSQATAGRLHDQLVHKFGYKNIFMDVDNIPAGVDFVEYLDSQLAKCDVFLAVIGPDWLTATDEEGHRRLDNPDDFVVTEIAAALKRRIRVIPVLIDGAHLPKADEVPPPLKMLLRRQALELRNTQFGRDVEELIERIDESLNRDRWLGFDRIRTALRPAAIVLALILLLGAGWLALRWLGISPWTLRDGDFALAPGQIFRDGSARGAPCPLCPEMVVVPAGRFTMGSPLDEKGRFPNEGPPHDVVIASAFALSRFPVTRGEFATFVHEARYQMDPGCSISDLKTRWELSFSRAHSWNSPGFAQDDRHPVVCASWNDADAYASWLSTRTGKRYRLPTEAEREYAARAGTVTQYYFGDLDRDYCRYGNGADLSAKTEFPNWDVLPCDDRFAYTSPVGTFLPNAFGLYDMLGNIWQWVEDCYHENYDDAPVDGSAWLSERCTQRGVRGGSWLTVPRQRRIAARGSFAVAARLYHTGFRLARALDNR